MRYLKPFKESEEEFESSPRGFDLSFYMAKIKEKYTQESVEKAFNDEVREWVEDPKDYEKSGDGGAEDMILVEMISYLKKKFGVMLNQQKEDALVKAIQEEFPILKY